MNEVKTLQNQVIDNDYCIGCGACASLESSPFRMQLNEYGNFIAVQDVKSPNLELEVLKVCPFSNESLNEDELSEIFLPDVPNTHPLIGKYYKSYAGFVKTEPFRKAGSSGGFGKWLGYKLLSLNLIDFYIHVVPKELDNPSNFLYEYKIETNAEVVSAGSKSSYYPVTLEKIIDEIKEREGRFAITGVPCFIKSLRLLSNYNPELKSKIAFTIGIFCGGMKSANHSKVVGWQLGVEPDNLDGIDFRIKSENEPASEKIYKVWSKDKSTIESQFSDRLVGTGWNGYFTPKACFFCDDVVSETADVSLGDAWLPKYINDSEGTSIMVIRNKTILEIIQKSFDSDEIFIEELTADEVAKSQAGGFRQRREALSYRIGKKEKSKDWYPIKRVNSGDYTITEKRKKIYLLREQIAKMSQIYYLQAYSKNNINYFIRKMSILEYKYKKTNLGNIRFLRYLLSILKNKVLNKIKK